LWTKASSTAFLESGFLTWICKEGPHGRAADVVAIVIIFNPAVPCSTFSGKCVSLKVFLIIIFPLASALVI
jgi:hypothetical protein